MVPNKRSRFDVLFLRTTTNTKLNDQQQKTSAVCALFPIKPVVYKCTSCLNYDLCESCHHDCAPPPATNTSHKPSHKFKMITVSTGN